MNVSRCKAPKELFRTAQAIPINEQVVMLCRLGQYEEIPPQLLVGHYKWALINGKEDADFEVIKKTLEAIYGEQAISTWEV